MNCAEVFPDDHLCNQLDPHPRALRLILRNPARRLATPARLPFDGNLEDEAGYPSKYGSPWMERDKAGEGGCLLHAGPGGSLDEGFS
jgi:hypothetical protein